MAVADEAGARIGCMEFTHLGRTGLTVSRLCLGTMNFGPQTEESVAHGIMDTAHEQGINFFDTANGYGGGDRPGWSGGSIGRWGAGGGGRRGGGAPGPQGEGATGGRAGEGERSPPTNPPA